jgi:lipoprotein-anchoring transpeptidase ErfK/SrfK
VGTVVRLSRPDRNTPARTRRASAADVRRAKAARRRRRRITRAIALGVLALVMLAALGGLAVADRSSADKIPDGVTVGGVDVGGLSERAALARLEERIGAPSKRPVTVKVAGKTRKLTAEDAGVSLDLQGAVDDAMAEGRKGFFVARGWRAVTGGSVDSEIATPVSVDRRAVDKFVARIAKDVNRPAVDAELAMSVSDVAVTPEREGRRLAGAASLEKRIVRAFRSPAGRRRVKAKTAVVQPKVTEKEVWAQNPTIVTVAHDANTVRIFKKGEVVATYQVAVGSDEFPTPRGRFSVDRKETNPVWNVPNSEWAGDLAGKTIPGGDPRNPLVARWVGISGPVGFHGTKDIGSIGSRASHGCVRMAPADVIDLSNRVEVGTPILIA